tara:strand:+ start:461 stop:655 length:195 start_codon:yes stop_codon:yes gene_type:complete
MAKQQHPSYIETTSILAGKPLKVPDVNWGGTFSVTKLSAPIAISNNRRDLLKKLTDENPELADW